MELATLPDLRAACAAIAAALGPDFPFAIVGGSACMLLGGRRATVDVDFAVPAGRVSEARRLLAASPSINVDARTRHTYCLPPASSGPVPIEILSPPVMLRFPFDQHTPTYDAQSVKVLHPLILLRVKLDAIGQRSTDAKRLTDYEDILFLMTWLKDHGVEIRKDDVPPATPERVQTLTELYGGEEVWEAAGWPWP